MDDHYFSADPSVRVPAGAGAGVGLGPRAWRWPAAPASSRRAGSTSAPRSCFRETEPPAAGRILDLGCGYGVIGLAVAVGRARTRS